MGKILIAEEDGVQVLKFVGDVRLALGPTISTFLDHLKGVKGFRSLVIDLSETEAIDSTALGLIAKTGICTREHFDSKTSIISPREDITRVLHSMSMEEVCVITSEPLSTPAKMRELPQEICSEETMRDQVLDAHRTLMAIDDDNYSKFHDLVEALEHEKKSGSSPDVRRAC